MAPSPGLFVGRVWELAQLRAALNDCLTGRGKLFLITGEAGIGKTTLVRKVADMAGQQGCQVLWGRCWEGAETPAFWPWIQIFRSLSGQGPAGAHDLAGLVPGLEGSSERSDYARLRLFDAAAGHIQALAHEQPRVLIFEDLHEADRSSLKLLEFLAHQIHTSPLLVLATCRKPDMELDPEDAEELASIMRLGHRIPLAGLGEPEVAELLAKGFDIVLTGEELSTLRHRTEGNPFFVDEIARDLVTQEQPAQFTPATFDVPAGLKAPIRRRLALLTDEDRALLEVAAVIGREFSFEVLVIAGQVDRPTALRRLSALATRRLVDAAGFGVGPYRFSHALVRETIYRDLPDLKRREIHGRVGLAIEELHRSDLDRYADQLAHHFLQAAVLGEAPRALDYSRRAGLLAAGRFGYDEAVDHYQRALALAGAGEPSIGIDILLALGDAQWWAGRPGESEESFQAAARQARAANDVRRLAEAALRVGEAGYGGAYSQAWIFDAAKVRLLEEARTALGDERSSLRVRVCGRLATALYFAPYDTSSTRDELSSEAVQLARQLGDPATLAYALNARHLAVWEPDNLDERLALSEEIVELARGSGEYDLELTGLAWRISDHYELGDAARADREIAAYSALAEQLGYPNFRAAALMFQATQATFHGEFSKAEELAVRSRDLGERIGDVNISLSHSVQMAIISWLQGRSDESLAFLEPVIDAHPPELRPLLRLTGLRRLGRVEGVEESFQQVWQAADHNPGAFWFANYAAALCLIAAQASPARAAAEIYDRVMPYKHRWVLPGRDPIAPLGPVAYYLGILAAGLDRFDEAAGHFRSAAETAEKAGSPPFRVLAHAAWGAMLVRRGREADLKEAAGLLAAAAGGAEKLKMALVAKEVEAALRRIGAGTPAEPDGSQIVVSSVLRCEGDYWTIVFENAVSRVKDSRGMRYLRTLLDEPGREFHVLDLAAGGRSGEQAQLSKQSLLDPAAKAAYRERLAELEIALQEAEDDNDLERAGRARSEKDALVDELTRATGLGGRDRLASAPAERARSAVTKSIRSSLKRIASSNPRLGAHLAATIRTGYFCSYQPDPRIAARWTG